MCGVMVVLLGSLTGCGHTDIAKQASSSQATAVVKPKPVSASFNGKVVKTKHLKLEITQTKVLPVGEKGNENGSKPVLAIWFKATNLTKAKTTAKAAWTTIFTAYQQQASQHQLTIGTSPDQTLRNSQTQNIAPGHTVTSAIAYELVDQQTPVTLKAVAERTLGTKVFGVKATLAAASAASASAASAAATQQSAAAATSAAAASQQTATQAATHTTTAAASNQKDQSSASDDSSVGMTPAQARQWAEDEYRANEYQRSPDGKLYHVMPDGSSSLVAE